MTAVTQPKIQTFRDMVAWQECRKLYAAVFDASKSFPKEEMFGLTSQMRRAANSAAANIAEGFGRHSAADKLHFYVMSRGSLTELQSHIILANDVGLLDNDMLSRLEVQSAIAHKLVVGLTKATQARSS